MNYRDTYYSKGIIYEGDYKEGKRHGKGKQYSTSFAAFYEGDWKDDDYNGKGKRFHPNGGDTGLYFDNDSVRTDGSVFYNGEYKDGDRHGTANL